jgi:hypothetical protein
MFVMTNLFKKSALAVAIFAVAGAAQAEVTLTGTPSAVSKQYKALTVASNQVDIKFVTADKSAFAAGNKIVVTFAGGQLASAAATITATVAGAQNATPAAITAVTLTRESVSENSATYVIGALTPALGDLAAATIAATATITLPASSFSFTSSSVLASNAVTVDVAIASSANVVVTRAAADTGKTKTMFAVVNQFETKFDGETAEAAGKVIDKTINLSANRRAFTGTTNADKYTFSTEFNTANVSPKDTNGDALTFALSATRGKVNYQLTGDFSWIQDTDASASGIQPASGTVAVTSTGGAISGLTVAADKITFTADAATTEVQMAFDVRQGGTTSPVALNDTKFALTSEQVYTNGADEGSMIVASNKAAGDFDNNGSSASVYYMPFGANVTQILYATETAGVADANIRVSARDEKGVLLLDGVVLGKTAARGITELSTPLAQALAAKGFTSGKVRLTVEADAPGIQVFSAYNVAGDRLATK